MLASFTNRQLGINNKSISKNTEKLASGYRINRVADDAAGLSISEKMRGQIRGLLRGGQNVLEGCSLIDTADGAMAEQAGILQRIRELTIEAYNDTYTQGDRLQIQKEVDAHLEELDRIAKQTEYNTIKILQGNKVKISVTTEIAEPEEEYRYVHKNVTTRKEIPAWLKTNCDLDLKLNNNKIGSNVKQDVSDYVIINENKIDPSKPEIFYGPKDKIPGGFKGEYGGEWTESLKDNYSAVVSFDVLAECTDKTGLLEKLMDLSGVAIAYECATCSNRAQGFYFYSDDINVSSINSLEDLDDESAKFSYETVQRDIKGINLQDYINMAGKVMDKDSYNATGNTKSYEDYVKEESGKIAGALVNEIIKNGQSEHFIRITGNDTKPYDVVFYDFRDDGVTETKLAGNAIGNAYVNLSVQTQVKNTPQVIEHVNEEYNGLYIQVAANTRQGVDIDLPDTTLASLGLEGYTIFRDGYCSVGKNEMYDPSLFEGAEYLGNNKWYNGHVGGHVVTDRRLVSGTRVIQELETVLVHPGGTNNDGEDISPIYSTQVKSERTENYSYISITSRIVGGHPVTFTAYEPDTLLRVDRAIDKLLESRADLGAMKNRLEHAYLNDMNGAENLQASESKIRDADLADEMVQFSSRNIIQQAAQSMLTQANSMPEGILALIS
ncbi:MAG: hypothetical protein HFH68_10840 [Lachnospiraceae bacterium]|nr:hypothetical protein [Lachnospiraceae bacterium]